MSHRHKAGAHFLHAKSDVSSNRYQGMELPLESYDCGALLSEVWPCPGAHCSAGCACKTMEPESKEQSLDADQHEPRQYGQWNRVN
jgi:hypothetical protein